MKKNENRLLDIKRNKKIGFTLVELLAVIVILAIILVIAVPKIMNTIKDTTKASFESSAKMVAAQVENQYTVAKTLGKEFGDTGNCKQDWSGLNDTDYESCTYDISDGTAKVTLKGSERFNGLSVCEETRSSATAIEESCEDADVTTAATYLEELLAQEETLQNGLVQTTAEYNGTTYNAGIRYVGEIDEVKNKVYYNCEDTDSNGVVYGGENYDYANSCEVWRILGVYNKMTDVTSGNIQRRVKLVNIESTFEASWDSSSNIGVYYWGPYNEYEGSDLMYLLNGYYIGAANSECKYCNARGQETC